MQYMTNFDLQVSFRVLVIARACQACSMAFLFVPINTIAYIGLPPGKSNNASALINLMRNLGGSFGVSLATTMLDRRSQFHDTRLLSHITAESSEYARALSSIATTLVHQGATAIDAQRQALGVIFQSVTNQSQMLSYIDVFHVLAIGAFAIIPLALSLKSVKPGQTAAAHH
jgi:DHA2 family multidrug resistance protein